MKPVRNHNTIAETNNFIVLEEYSKRGGVCEGNNLGYQSEHDLEEELLKDLRELGY